MDIDINTEINFDRSSNILLVDGGYYMFYRYFATLKWYTFQFKDKSEINHENIHEDENFLKAFYKHVKQDLEKLKKKWKYGDNIIFCKDSSRNSIWRYEIDNQYKEGRVQSDTLNTNMFKIFFEYLKEMGVGVCVFEGLEADDMVYIICKHLHQSNFQNKIVIITNDCDYLQLKRENVELYNMQGKGGTDISVKSLGSAEKDLLMKILTGDQSDNIPAVCSKLGKKTAEKLIEMKEEELYEWLDKKGCRENFEKNRKMISFEYIPQELIESFNGKYRIIIK